MSLDGYTKFKTPFYEIKVSDSHGKRTINLPHHILRLINKVDIYEPLGGSEGAREFTSITLTFIEGSREPASPDASLGTSGLYNIANDSNAPDMAISGSLTNRVGIITDLRFSGNHGITFITAGEKRTNTIDSKIQTNVIGKSTTRKWDSDPKAPEFLFNERNIIEVTWGYKEDPKTVRTLHCYIIMVAVDFPEQGQIKTTITCQDTGAFLDQITPKYGTPFGKVIRTSKDGSSVVVYQDLPTDELLRTIIKEAGFAGFVSKNLPSEKMDEDKQKMWIAGESFAQFMDRLARLHNCYWKVIIDPKTKKENLFFLKKSTFDSHVLSIPKGYLTYRTNGSILKNLNIKVDFGGLTGALIKSTDAEGNPIVDEMIDQGVFAAANKSSKNNLKAEKSISANPISNNPIPAALGLQNVARGGVCSNVESTPRSDKDSTKTIAGSEADRAHRLIVVDFTTLGYTQLTPGTVVLDGIGVRYSGLYRIMTVQHSIDSSGYITKCTATSQFLPGGGTRPQEAAPMDEEMIEMKVFRRMQGADKGK